jgi:CHAT domain-containing protein
LFDLVETPGFADMWRIEADWGFSREWATTQNKLGECYAESATDNQDERLDRAIGCFKSAMRVRRGISDDLRRRDEYVETLRNLSGVLYRKRLWRETLVSCTEAMEALEHSRSGVEPSHSRITRLVENSVLFDMAVACCVKLSQFGQALVYSERAKARNLVEMIEQRTRTASSTESSHNDSDDSRVKKRIIPLKLRPHQVKIIGELKESYPFSADWVPLTLPKPLAFSDIRAVVKDSKAVLVEFCVTDSGTFVFLLNGNDGEMAKKHVIRVPEFTRDVLNDMLLARTGSTSDRGLLAEYYRWRRRETGPQPWLDSLEHVTGEIYARLLRAVHEKINKLWPNLKRMIIVPSKGLNVLPLHAAHYEMNGQRRYWLDDFEITYVPSCAVLEKCLMRERENRGRDVLFAVQNPNPSDKHRKLPLSDWEVEDAMQYFARTKVLSGEEATRARVKDFIGEGHEVLLSCHGIYVPGNATESHLTLHGDRLPLSEILALDLSKAWLVVISACETAMSAPGDVLDEVQGLHTAFIVAGATTAIGSLWTVSDLSTALLMKRFHENIYKRHMDKASAIRRAQQWVRDLSLDETRRLLRKKQIELQRLSAHERLTTIDLAAAQSHVEESAAKQDGKPFAHPFWWAAFQCVGAGWPPNSDH